MTDLNPWKEGDYLCYGETVEVGDGTFAAYYFIEYCPPSGEKVRVFERCRFGKETYKTADLARMNAVSASQIWVRQRVG
ncbi:MAG: hypothetical protein H7A05_08055 [Pseudomonadales bacterium]|nr:hypothetical protein [Pseudomonadales bacterium]MCP5344559.1 hypothetical protein [Pseudomonadales bacterium]